MIKYLLLTRNCYFLFKLTTTLTHFSSFPCKIKIKISITKLLFLLVRIQSKLDPCCSNFSLKVPIEGLNPPRSCSQLFLAEKLYRCFWWLWLIGSNSCKWNKFGCSPIQNWLEIPPPIEVAFSMSSSKEKGYHFLGLCGSYWSAQYLIQKGKRAASFPFLYTKLGISLWSSRIRPKILDPVPLPQRPSHNLTAIWERGRVFPVFRTHWPPP